MPGGVHALAALGINPVGWDLIGIRYVSGGRQAEADFSAGRGRGVRRTDLHTALRSAAAAAGVQGLPLLRHARWRSRPGKCASERRDPARRLDLTSTGATFWQLMGFIRRRVARSVWRWAPTDHSASVNAATTSYGPGAAMWRCTGGSYGEAYVTPVGADIVGVAVLSARRVPFEEQLNEFPQLRERLANASAATRVRGAGPLRQRVARRVAGRALLVGDAGGYVDALTGEGISLWIAQARAAVSAVGA